MYIPSLLKRDVQTSATAEIILSPHAHQLNKQEHTVLFFIALVLEVKKFIF